MKKGEGVSDISSKTIYFVVVAIMLTVIFMLYILFVAKVNSQYVPHEIRLKVHNHRFMSSCFSYRDPDTQRIYSGMIDLKKFTEDNLKTCYKTYQNRRYAYKLGLAIGDKEPLIMHTSNFMETRPYDQSAKQVIVQTENATITGLLTIGYQFME